MQILLLPPWGETQVHGHFLGFSSPAHLSVPSKDVEYRGIQCRLVESQKVSDSETFPKL